jgi:uncharacterized protein YcbK (DUF882 family)
MGRGRRGIPGLVLFCLCIWLWPLALLAEEPPPPPPSTPPPKKKEDKDRPAADARGRSRRTSKLATRIKRVVSLVNLWTAEVLPVVDGQLPAPKNIDRFLRCHFTGHVTRIDTRLLKLALKAADKFKSDRIEIISAYRHPKYNLMLRKKGREVAGGSNHMAGKALDFRLPGIATGTLRRFVLAAGLGGVGFYPRSRFVHIDVGKRRTWRGQ